eukprot:CAMPEP_0118916218 /NCGR_PEP_ID=MMETSP1166-20130328/16276_1 /TAXON_ID=1104430 /ORGANISM="Chrysoreinhardia sp, Strain CCMP3193" /LENGTH=59 /DNA_ID=CAMNT_0006856055 /DNA_START=192 /DNA_END=372 /DNA_ORIENTATION=+
MSVAAGTDDVSAAATPNSARPNSASLSGGAAVVQSRAYHPIRNAIRERLSNRGRAEAEI